MRVEIKRLHLAEKATTVYVTHDQVEAMAMGDRIIIMSNAVVQQMGTPAEVYYDPANLFVARFIGSPGMNLLPCRYSQGELSLPGGANTMQVPAKWKPTLDSSLPDDGSVVLGFRPEAVRAREDGHLQATVYASDLHGGFSMLHLEIGADKVVHGRAERDAAHAIGELQRFDLNPAMVRFFHPQTEAALVPERVPA
jgi:ABC-type sugar transport system ATPase subunit